MFIMALIAMLGVQTQAQIVSSRSSMTTRQVVDNENWSTLYLQWNPMSINPDHGDSESFTGFSIGYNKAVSLTQSIPLFLEAGLGIQYSFDSEEESDRDYDESSWEESWYMLSAKIPVNLMYKFDIPNTNISILPNAGLDFRFNIFGKSKEEWTYHGDTESESWNLFDDDDMDGHAYKRFQMGWHIGVNAMFNKKFMVGVSYGSDFSEIRDDVKLSGGAITLGYCF